MNSSVKKSTRTFRGALTKDALKLDGIRIFFCIAFGAVILRLFQIQVIEHSKYTFAADAQHWGQYDIPAMRGDIFTSDGNLLAGTQNYYLMYGEPQKVTDPLKLSLDLADYFSKIKFQEITAQSSDSAENVDTIKERLRKHYFEMLSKESLWVSLEHRVSPEQRDDLEKLNLTGIGFEIEPIRFYPENTLAAHVLGFVASDEKGDSKGYFGIEGSFDEDLRGRKGRLMEEVDARGTPILIGGSKKTDAIQGSNMYLTIDRSVQYMVEQKLKEGVEKYDAKSGTVIIMDPFTGSVIAMANYPTFYPSKFNDEDLAMTDDQQRKKIERRNVAIAETYEPGSIVKPLTVAAAVDMGLVTEDTTYSDDGPVNYSGAWINNWDGKHYGILNIVQLLQKSNNIGAAWVGHKVGSKNIYNYFSNFGLGTRTNIELEGEDSGILREYRNWTDIDLANISFGQGMSATPLQMLNAFNSLANGGFLLQPKIVSKIADNGKLIDIPTKIVRRVISKETSDTMVDMLQKAAEGGEAKYFVLKNYKVAGKTGTAQIPINGKYDLNKTNASFVGFLVGSKKFTMIVKFQEPRTSIYAAETAAPMWMDIAAELVKFYNLPPDKELSTTSR
jgi:cell division protein FtsI/penicillin-binding protein 2